MSRVHRRAEGEVVALENGADLREWIERNARALRPTTIRCTTYVATFAGLQWLRRLASDSEPTVALRVLCDVDTLTPQLTDRASEFLAYNHEELRVAPARRGRRTTDTARFHPKVLILDDCAAVVGSANLTGRALGIGPKPHNVEVSVGLSGPSAQAAISRLAKSFDRWWRDAARLPAEPSTQTEEENNPMPEYVVFHNQLDWGIAQLQTQEGGIFGPARWLAVSDVSPADPGRRPAHVEATSDSVAALDPQPWCPPAARLDATPVRRTKAHFRRLAAYWLQAENRQGQLDSLPVLQLRHQTSLVEYLARTDAPREMLIADEVGLGKTIELGLLLSRLKAANPDLRVLYITPAGLVANVVDEFRNLGFDDVCVYGASALDETLYTPARLARERHDPWVVASMHRLGTKTNATQLAHTKWDVVIADECHRLRRYGDNAQQWYRVLETAISEHLAEDGRVYFLSGTPHQGNREVFLNLVSLMCNLPRQAPTHEQEEALSGRVIYRTKEEVFDWAAIRCFRSGRFASRPMLGTPRNTTRC